jgi:probable HAF family extracellular repeat protein
LVASAASSDLAHESPETHNGPTDTRENNPAEEGVNFMLARNSCSITLAVLALAGSAPSASAQSISALDPGTVPMGVSGDGSVVVGASPNGAFRWTRSSGLQALGMFGGPGASSEAQAVSGDGTVVVGNSLLPGSDIYHAFRWTMATGMQDLGSIPAAISYAVGANADGSVVVGMSHEVFGQGFRWTSQPGVVGIPSPAGTHLANVRGVSASGGVVVGFAFFCSCNGQAARWNAGSWEPLGVLSGDNASEAFAISADASTIVGGSVNSVGTYRAFRWTADTGMQPLGTLAGLVGNVLPSSVSGDGSMVVGWVENQRPFIWTASMGMVDLSGYFATRGVNLDGWVLGSPAGISADGLTIVGSGTFNGVSQGWIADLHCRADFNHSGDLSTQDIFDFLNAWFAASAAADFNGANGLTEQDIFDFLNAWFAGCA